jgi:hypothetical protein
MSEKGIEVSAARATASGVAEEARSMSWHRLASLSAGAELGVPKTVEFRPE